MLLCDYISNIKYFWPVFLISNVSGQLLLRNFDIKLLKCDANAQADDKVITIALRTFTLQHTRI